MDVTCRQSSLKDINNRLHEDWQAKINQEGRIYYLKNEAFSDLVDASIKLGYFINGRSLMRTGKYEEALISLDPNVTSAKTTLAQVLQKILTHLPTSENLKCSELQHHGIRGRCAHGMTTPFSVFTSGLDELASAILVSFNQSAHGGNAFDIGAVCAQKKRKHSDPTTGTELKPCEPRLIAPHLLTRSDYECSLCFRLLHKPVTTPCGHAFCTGCLNRCLDHNPRCPLCKHSLTEYLASKKFSVNVLIQKIIKQYFEKEFHEREEIHAEEMEELRGASKGHGESVIPLFICTIAFPTIPCPLHIFEPRYRLMIRQCIESGSRQFGMCVPSEQNEFSDYGCMLKIEEVQTLPDGRSIITIVGGRRFKVLSRGMREGYNTANVRFIEDDTVQGM
ncbi:LON peptidase N-terminal domain and RING finger protein 1-like [Anneissia japonica]|uniref:LON peptidase N-terminal domain and RING finger protein 1-like n=1 Tax=Anneissia japonica TaxID=1529436 RepID=UPI0014255B94|nr:LON peptidase N-terminal domain and RING finger protein 1-like [Anneissia japonica]